MIVKIEEKQKRDIKEISEIWNVMSNMSKF